jgi:cbb3-type cytochrome oxidase maturation protein
MSVLYIVLPLALLVVGAAVVAFVWATNRGQFDDLETPAVRALHEDAPAKKPDAKKPPARPHATGDHARKP